MWPSSSEHGWGSPWGPCRRRAQGAGQWPGGPRRKPLRPGAAVLRQLRTTPGAPSREPLDDNTQVTLAVTASPSVLPVSSAGSRISLHFCSPSSEYQWSWASFHTLVRCLCSCPVRCPGQKVAGLTLGWEGPLAQMVWPVNSWWKTCPEWWEGLIVPQLSRQCGLPRRLLPFQVAEGAWVTEPQRTPWVLSH